MKKNIFLLITFTLVGIIILAATTSFAEIRTSTAIEQTSQIQESPNNDQASAQDTEPQPEPGPSRGRVLPVRK
ncbi:MAG: hypothetical protein U9N63_11220 [Pseudomonadota bacterium]|nr:hypothetical protein [Pseudomonadota bacterium]